MGDGELLELLEFYQDMTETQNELIYRLSKLVKRQAEDLAHMRSVMNSDMDEKLKGDMRIAMEVLKEYNDSMEP